MSGFGHPSRYTVGDADTVSLLTAENLAAPLTIVGNGALLDSEMSVILNSSQSKTPVGADAWVRRTIEASRSNIISGRPIVTSIGMNTWELTLWTVGEHGGNAVVVLPEPSHGSIVDEIGRISIDFNLHPDHHAWVFFQAPKVLQSTKRWWETRDSITIELARRLIPVSVRTDGRLDGLVSGTSGRDKVLDNRFRAGYSSRSRKPLKIESPDVCREFHNWSCVTHWTCRCYGPWPGETSADFYRDVVSSGDEYPRLAVATLLRILQERKLRGSGNHMRNGTTAVAFTECEPSEAIKLMKWRKRYVRPTFEPYGIAICKKAALCRGIRPVTYVESGNGAQPDAPGLLQGYGTGEWQREKEWRAIGEVDLSDFRCEDILVLVPSEPVADQVRKSTEYRVVSLESKN